VLQTTEADVFFYACNGHGAWEAVVENIVPPGGLVLVPGTGHFSESWAAQTEALGRRVCRTPWVEGWPIDAAAVTQALLDDTAHEIVAVFVVHTDTSSGITSDIAALRAAVDAAQHPALFVVDVVASLAAEPFAMDAQRVDVAVGASQKGLMCPPGLGFVAANARAFAAAQANTAPRYYWDFVARKSPLSYRKFCGTPPQNLLAALQAALALIQQEGLAQVLARHRLLAAWCTRRWRAGAKAARWTSLAVSRPAAPTPSPPSPCRRAPMSTRCVPWRAKSFRWPLPARWARCTGARFASAISATRTRPRCWARWPWWNPRCRRKACRWAKAACGARC
jgi:aspartate aminotransferase-like enzyme